MEDNIHLENAVEMAENTETSFIVEGDRLHAVDPKVASYRKDKSNPKLMMPMMVKALNALIDFAEGKVPPHFIEIAKNIATKENEDPLTLVSGVVQIYSHLPHYEKNKLSGLVHHSSHSPRGSWA